MRYNEAMDQRKAAALVLIVIAVFGGGLFIWNKFINFGTLEIEAKAPFEYSIDGISYKCEIAPCSQKLKPQTYTVVIQKEHFQPETHITLIRRGQTSSEKITFTIVPYIKKIGEAIKKELKISLERKEKEAILKIAEKTYKFPIKSETPVAIFETTQPLYRLLYLGIDQKTNKQALLGYKDPEKNPEAVAFFTREIMKARLIPSESAKGVYLIDDDENDIYFINIEFPARQNIARNTAKIEALKSSPNDEFVLYQTGTGETLEIWLADTRTREQHKLENVKIALPYILFKDTKTLLIISKTPMITEAKTEELTEKTVFITQYDINSKTFELVQKTNDLPAFPAEVFVDPSSKELRFIIGKDLFVLITNEKES